MQGFGTAESDQPDKDANSESDKAREPDVKNVTDLSPDLPLANSPYFHCLDPNAPAPTCADGGDTASEAKRRRTSEQGEFMKHHLQRVRQNVAIANSVRHASSLELALESLLTASANDRRGADAKCERPDLLRKHSTIWSMKLNVPRVAVTPLSVLAVAVTA